MLFLISEDKQVKEVIEESLFSDLGILEREHMERWIESTPQMLNEDLKIITTEYDRFDKTNNRLDILAMDSNGKLVIIELKRDLADKFVDLQAIHYAAYCSALNLDQVIDIKARYDDVSTDIVENDIKKFINNANFSDFDNQPRIILVANDFREETLAAVMWLRDNGIDIKCVKLEPYVVGNELAVKPETIIPLPDAEDFMMQVEAKKQRISIETKKTNNYSSFWKLLSDKIEKESPELLENCRSHNNYTYILTGYGNVHFEWLFEGRTPKEFQVSLHFEKTSEKENKKLLDYFYSKRDELQSKINEEIIFDGEWGNKYARIYIKTEDTSLNEENADWGYDKMMNFLNVMKPYLDAYFNK